MRPNFFIALLLASFASTASGQSTSPVGPVKTVRLPKPSFVLHDKKLHAKKPQTVINPDGTFYISAGTSMIQVSSLSFSADGKLLAVGSTPGIVDVWNLETKSKLRAFEGGTEVALSPDGHLLAKDGNGIEIIDLPSGRVIRSIPWQSRVDGQDNTIEYLAFDSTGARLLVASNVENLKVFDVENGALLATLVNTRRGTFSPDGSLVVGGDYKHLVDWSTTTWKPIREFPNGPDYVTVVATDPQHDIEVVGGPNSARLLRLNDGEQLAVVGAGYTNYSAIRGKLIFTYAHEGLTISSEAGEKYCLFPDSDYYAMSISPDDHWLAAAPAHKLTDVAVWNLSEIVAACTNGTNPDSPK